MKNITMCIRAAIFFMGVVNAIGTSSEATKDNIGMNKEIFSAARAASLPGDWDTLHAKLANYQSVYDVPIPSLLKVNTIPDAPICGGGKLTLALDGKHNQVNYYVTKSDFWAGTLKPEGIFPKTSIIPAPFCRLDLTIHDAASQPDGYQHVQDMANAEIRSTFPLNDGILHVRSIALAQKDMVVFEMKAEGGGTSVNVHLQADNDNNNFFIIEGVHDDKTVWLRKEHSGHVNVNTAAALRVLGGKNVGTIYSDKIEANLSFRVEPGQPATLVFSAKGGKDEYQQLEDAIAALDSVDFNTIPGLLKEHATFWQNYWLKSWIDITDPTIERYYYGALYVLGCSIDLDSRVAPGLAGGWITHPHPIWGGNYTMNYNGEAPFWGLFSSNRGELILPYARVCMDYIPSGRRLAKELKTKGIVMPVMIGPWGVCVHGLNGDALGQKSNATMAALSLIWNYEFYRDRSFLEQYTYPFVRELMVFWEDNLVLDDTGRYVIKDDAARERDPGDLNAGNSLGYLHKVLQAAIHFSKELGVDENRRELWQDYTNRLSDYPVVAVDGKLCFKEAENRMEISTFRVGDNPVVLDHVYPGGSLDESNSERGQIIARNTLSYLNSWNQENAFPRIFSQAVRAKWPGKDLLDLFKKRITSGSGPHEILRRNNTFIPNIHSFEGVGAIEFINSMLAQAHGGVLKVFDVWPAEWDASFHHLRVQGAFLVSGQIKGGKVCDVEILSERGGLCRMESCWKGYSIQVQQIGKAGESPVKVRREANIYAWQTVPGGIYRVTMGNSVEEKVSNPPLMLVPIIDSEAAQGQKYTNAAIDVLLTPEICKTQLKMDVIYADESRRDSTTKCRFSTRDETIARVDSNGQISGTGQGMTTIDIKAEIDGVCLNHSIQVYVLANHVIAEVNAYSTYKNPRPSQELWKDSPKCLVGPGTDSPDITALHRANSYKVYMYLMNKAGEDAKLYFDFNGVYSLDEMWIWNFNCPDDYRVLPWVGGTACGMRDVTIEYSEDGQNWNLLKTEDYPFRLARATGKQWMAATNLDDGKHSPIRFHGVKARCVRLTANPSVGIGNWGGRGFGLSEVRFTYLNENDSVMSKNNNNK